LSFTQDLHKRASPKSLYPSLATTLPSSIQDAIVHTTDHDQGWQNQQQQTHKIKFTLFTNTNIQTVAMVGLCSICSQYAVFLTTFTPQTVTALCGVQLTTHKMDAIIGNSNKNTVIRVSLQAHKRLLKDLVSEDSVDGEDEETINDERKFEEDSVSEDSVNEETNTNKRKLEKDLVLEDSVNEETSAGKRQLEEDSASEDSVDEETSTGKRMLEEDLVAEDSIDKETSTDKRKLEEDLVSEDSVDKETSTNKCKL
jgi:hypothetical protein